MYSSSEPPIHTNVSNDHYWIVMVGR